MVIDFSATWCGPCRFMEPVINEFAEKYTDVEFVKIDVDELSVLLSSFSRTCLINFLFLLLFLLFLHRILGMGMLTTTK